MRKKSDRDFVTIKDVAKDSEVSIATVSRVINGGSVKLDKKKRVLASIAKLNYVPNNSARNLASVNNTKRIVLIVPEISFSYYLEIIKGFKEVAKIYNYDPVIESYNLSDNIYDEINRKYGFSSEVKGILQIGKKLEIPNKEILDWNTEFIKYENIEGEYTFESSDEYISQFLQNKLGLKDKKNKKYLTNDLDGALKLYNKGIRDEIITLENTKEISKICPNIDQYHFSFYALGATLTRILIKQIKNEEIIELTIK